MEGLLGLGPRRGEGGGRGPGGEEEEEPGSGLPPRDDLLLPPPSISATDPSAGHSSALSVGLRDTSSPPLKYVPLSLLSV